MPAKQTARETNTSHAKAPRPENRTGRLRYEVGPSHREVHYFIEIDVSMNSFV